MPKRSNLPALAGAIGTALTTGGPAYAFGLYGEALKKNLGLSQSNLDTISTFFFVAGLFSWASGLFADRFGPRLAIVLGGCSGCLTLLGFWLIAKQEIVVGHRASLVALLSLLLFLACVSAALVTGSVFKVLTVTTSESSRGPAVGVAKGLVGLGSGAYTCMFESLKAPHESDLDFLPLAGVLFFFCATLPALLWIPSRQEMLMQAQHGQYFSQDARPWHFRMLYAALAAMAALILNKSLLQLFHAKGGGADSHDDPANHESGNHTNSSASVWIMEEHPHDDEAVVMVGDDGVDLADSRRLLSSSAGTFPWTAMLLFILWWGPLIVMWRCQPNRALNEDENNEPVVASSSHAEMTATTTASTTTNRTANNDDDDEEECTLDDSTQGAPLDDTEHLEERLLSTTTTATNGQPAPASSPASPAPTPTTTTVSKRPANRNLTQMLQTPEAACLLWTAVILVGSGTVETNNMGQMVQALGFDKSVTPASLALFSVAQAGARVVTGALKSSHPRPVFFIAASAVGVVAHAILGFATTKWTFVFGVTLAGVAFGMAWPLMVLCIGEIFGPASFGANYLFYDGFSSAAGTLLLSKWIAQNVYDAHIHNSDSSPDQFTCLGADCFRWTHYAIAAFCVTCIGSSAVFLALTRDVYETSTNTNTQTTTAAAATTTATATAQHAGEEEQQSDDADEEAIRREDQTNSSGR